MLFPYVYVPHQMEKMQDFIDFIFFEVWCKASTSGPFSLSLFDANGELQEVMEAFYYSDAKGADFFYGHVERIYGLFAALTIAEVKNFQQWYRANNDIENLCANDPSTVVIRYADIPAVLEDVRDQLKSFFKDLYSHLDMAPLKAKIGEIDDHYDNAFWSANKEGVCPFCGIGDIKGLHHSKREAYDHYLPKALYPFNTVNFRNLAPACHECNSSYKLSKDPAHNIAGRRKAFYPYAAASYNIEIQVGLHHSDIANLKPTDITLQFGPAAIDEEIDTWKEVYGIEERYKGKLCSNDARNWLEEVRILHRDCNLEPIKYLASLNAQLQQFPVANCNFLKKPFLDACQEVDLLDVMQKYRERKSI